MPTRTPRAIRFSLGRRWAAGFALAVVLAACGGSDTTAYTTGEVEAAFREAGLPLQRLPSGGAAQPAMGEVSACPTRYRSRGALVSVSVCDDETGAAQVASDESMMRGNVAVEYAGYTARIHDQIDRALDSLGD